MSSISTQIPFSIVTNTNLDKFHHRGKGREEKRLAANSSRQWRYHPQKNTNLLLIYAWDKPKSNPLLCHKYFQTLNPKIGKLLLTLGNPKKLLILSFSVPLSVHYDVLQTSTACKFHRPSVWISPCMIRRFSSEHENHQSLSTPTRQFSLVSPAAFCLEIHVCYVWFESSVLFCYSSQNNDVAWTTQNTDE